MNVSKKGIELLKEFEGYRDKMYLDSAGLPTIGYGTLIDTEEEKKYLKERITKPEALRLLRKDIAPCEKLINIVLPRINQNRFDALCCFVYNVGRNNFRKSTLLKKIKTNPQDPQIRREFLRWVYADGAIVEGLHSRRAKEADLYFDNIG